MSNTNDLLGSDGITGLKTGNLGEGSYNLLYSASLDVGAAEPLSVTGVVLGGHSRQSSIATSWRLLDSIRGGFHEVPVATRGQEVGSYTTPWGSTARMVVAESASIFTWSDTPITATMQTTTPDDLRGRRSRRQHHLERRARTPRRPPSRSRAASPRRRSGGGSPTRQSWSGRKYVAVGMHRSACHGARPSAIHTTTSVPSAPMAMAKIAAARISRPSGSALAPAGESSARVTAP